MIRLGSNRLTVCRRGGMSVTQAGRGGMEWLAGGRRPRWSSPYSAQATAALKAQFPTQWATIRDYGFAHPALVPFINEDPMLVCSLIPELGITRWLIGQIAVSDMNLNIFDWCKYKFKYNTSKYTSFGSRLGASGTSGLIVHAGYTSGNIVRTYMRPTSDWVTRFSNISAGVIYELEHNFANNVMILNGASVALQWDRTALSAATMSCGTDDSYISSIETNDRIMALSIQNGVTGWVDTLTRTFHAGTGTIEYTDAQGNPWSPS